MPNNLPIISRANVSRDVAVEDGWALVDADPYYGLHNTSSQWYDDGQPAWLAQLQPMLPPSVASGARGLHQSLRVGAHLAAPWARRASSVGAQLSVRALDGARTAAVVGPPEAWRLAAGAWATSHRLGAAAQDQVRWIRFSLQERRIAEGLYAWLCEVGYIVGGQLQFRPELEGLMAAGVRRVRGLQYVSLAQWQRYCRALKAHRGAITPWGLAGLLKQA